MMNNLVSRPLKLILLMTLICLQGASFAEVQTQDYTRIVIFRHAPKIDIENVDHSLSSDLGLNTEGKRRANGLVELAEHYDISAIYSTNLARTRETVEPLAAAAGKKIDVSFSPFDYEKQLEHILKNHPKKTVVIVGHSNTVPGFINNALNEQRLPNLEHDAYDDIFILKYFSPADVKLVKMSYQVKTEINHRLFIKD